MGSRKWGTFMRTPAPRAARTALTLAAKKPEYFSTSSPPIWSRMATRTTFRCRFWYTSFSAFRSDRSTSFTCAFCSCWMAVSRLPTQYMTAVDASRYTASPPLMSQKKA